jgi:hypothetical protein
MDIIATGISSSSQERVKEIKNKMEGIFMTHRANI